MSGGGNGSPYRGTNSGIGNEGSLMSFASAIAAAEIAKRRSPFPTIVPGDILVVNIRRLGVWSHYKKGGEILCHVWSDTYLVVLEVVQETHSLWARVDAGWLEVSDGSENLPVDIYKPTDIVLTNEERMGVTAAASEMNGTNQFPETNDSWLHAVEGGDSWEEEEEGLLERDEPIEELTPFHSLSAVNSSSIVSHQTAEEKCKLFLKYARSRCERLAAALSSLIIRSYSLPRAKRIIRSLHTYVLKNYPGNAKLLKANPETFEDVLVIFNGRVGLKRAQVFDLIKSACCKSQANPLQAVADVVQISFVHFKHRPTTWVQASLPILVTESVRIHSNRFVMAAAEADMDLLRHYINSQQQDLLCIHSELQYTALHAAADFGQMEVVNELLAAGMSVNLKDPKLGQTSLHFAAFSGRIEVLQRLLEAGADRELKSYQGLLAYQSALKQGHSDCAEVLKMLPPITPGLGVLDVTLNSITVKWQEPHINPQKMAIITDYKIECELDEDLQPEQHVNEDGVRANAESIIRMRSCFTSELSCSFAQLHPACSYRLRVASHSVAGWGPWSQWLYVKTKAGKPSRPGGVEVRKVVKNGMLLNWRADFRTNGFPVEFYELEVLATEIMEANLIRNRLERKVEDESARGVEDGVQEEDPVEDEAVLVNQSISSRRIALRKQTRDAGQGGVSKLQRIIKHRDMKHLYKFVTGLEPNRSYHLRIRAYSHLGFSPWSAWSGPAIPQAGLDVYEFHSSDDQSMSPNAILRWVPPLLLPGVHVEAYELQLCRLKGPRTVHVYSLNMDHSVEEKFDHNFQQHKDPMNHGRNALEVEGDVFADGKGNKEGESDNRPSEDLDEFVTLCDTLQTEEYSISGLQACGRYQARIRSKIFFEDWQSWEHAMVSPMFVVPAMIPDPPLNVRPVVVHETVITELKKVSSELEGLTVGNNDLVLHDDDTINSARASRFDDLGNLLRMPIMESSSTAGSYHEDSLTALRSDLSLLDSKHSDVAIPPDVVEHHECLSVTHESITLTWVNGNLNGSIVEAYDIEMAIVRTYHPDDVIHAKEAFIGIYPDSSHDGLQKTQQDDSQGVSIQEFNRMYVMPTSMSRGLLDDSSVMSKSTSLANTNDLVWDNITTRGKFLSSQVFRIDGLPRNTAFAFRVRQRNEKGWSPFSHASPLICTYPSIPPHAPIIVSITATSAVISWQDDNQSQSALSALEFEVQWRQLCPSSIFLTAQHSQQFQLPKDENLESLVSKGIIEYQSSWYLVEKPTRENSISNFTTVRISRLIEGQWYIMRVRERTVVGWSPWSLPSLPFRTLAN